MKTITNVRTALAIIAIACTSSVQAAGPDPGVNVTVTNTGTNPVPVTGTVQLGGTAGVTVNNTSVSPVPVAIVASAAAREVVCFQDVAAGGTTSGTFIYFAGGNSINLHCPAGVGGIRSLTRVVLDPLSGLAVNGAKFTSYQAIIGVTTIPGLDGTGLENATAILGMFSLGDLDKTLPTPIDFTTIKSVSVSGMCSAIGSGVTPACGSRLWLIGTPL